MFTEVPDVRQITGEPRRRWWIDADLELIVWFDKNNRMIAFQLCYTIDGHQKALTWRERHGYFHSGIDSGENRPGRHKSTPILIMNGIFDKETVGNRLTKSAQGLPGEIASFVQQKISEYRTGKK
ncbi:MAG: hypothetical protein A2283_16030 [Lentisphaerae bacterium RIFOXYA12_FULL_48_11]|nr:MAG: hypothetical protein A2283_16030 [Lentisphaerae bacterium RIFOXYA12_FULL_48_11]